MQNKCKLKPTISCWTHHCNKSVIQLTIDDDDDDGKKCQICSKLDVPLNLVTRLDYPLVDANDTNLCLLLIRPSKGSFIEGFCNKSQLHIGIVDKHCQVLEYDHSGVKLSQGEEWSSCLAVCMGDLFGVDVDEKVVGEVWQTTFKEFMSDEIKKDWSPELYDPTSRNCFDFAIKFIDKINNQLNSVEKAVCHSKEAFCHRYVVSKMKTLVRYVALYKKTLSGVRFINI